MKRLHGFLVILLFAASVSAQQSSLYLYGSPTFNQSEFRVEEAGKDFTSVAYTQNPAYLFVWSNDYWSQYNNPGRRWRVTVSKQDNLGDKLEISVKRTGSGVTYGSNRKAKLQGGNNYFVIRHNETNFFYGRGSVWYIPLTFRLRGHSLTMGAGSHSSRVVFTVYDSW